MIKVDVLTTTRAEYGLMKPLIKRFAEDSEFELKLLVSGTHLSHEYGYTYNEIQNDNFAPTIKVDILSEKDGTIGVSETMANALIKFTDLFSFERPDFLFVDGDRYETLAVVIAAVNSNIPVVHNGGGATTEGAADEYYRHAITKMSYLHFTSTQEYRNRIIQMGENPSRVFAVGSLGIENIKTVSLLTKEELSKQLQFKLDKSYAVLTFHPVTLENNTATNQVMALLEACQTFPDIKFIITGANADSGGKEINQLLRNFASQNSRQFAFYDSLGMLRYLSALKYAKFVIGNSSSGLIEVPSFEIPTINIGDRQRGRLQAKSIINCSPVKNDISDAINKAISPDFALFCKQVINPNGDGNTSIKIINSIKDIIKSGGIDIKKKFYNIVTSE